MKRIVVDLGEENSACRCTGSGPSTGWWSPGIAQVTIGQDIRPVISNQSVYIPFNTAHRLENQGKDPLCKSSRSRPGPTPEEDDIIRLDDDYWRPEEK